MRTNSSYFKIGHDLMKDISWSDFLGRKVQLPEKIVYSSGDDILCDPDPKWSESKKHIRGILKLVYTTYDAKECELNHLLIQDGNVVYAYIANYHGDSFVVGIVNNKSEDNEEED